MKKAQIKKPAWLKKAVPPFVAGLGLLALHRIFFVKSKVDGVPVEEIPPPIPPIHIPSDQVNTENNYDKLKKSLTLGTPIREARPQDLAARGLTHTIDFWVVGERTSLGNGDYMLTIFREKEYSGAQLMLQGKLSDIAITNSIVMYRDEYEDRTYPVLIGKSTAVWKYIPLTTPADEL